MVDFLKVNTGTLKAKPMGKKGWHLVIQSAPQDTPFKVKLVMPGQKTIRMVRLRGGVDRITEGDSTSLTIPADGIGWFFLYSPFPAVSVFDDL